MQIRTRKVKVELSHDTRAALRALDADVQTLAGLVNELVATHARIVETLGDDLEEAAENGVVAVDAVEDALPPEMRTKALFTPYVSDDERVRETPFTRTPRSVQIAWLQNSALVDGEWHAGITIAKKYATDERHCRYMRHAVTGRLREMYEDGVVERRSSTTRGAMYEYRLTRK